MTFIIILTIIIIIALIYCFIHFRSRKKTPIILFSGRVGGGKSFSMTYDAINDYKRSVRKWRHINKPFFSLIYLWIPFFNKRRKKNELYGLAKPVLYSTYPILIKRRFYSSILTREIMLLDCSIPINSIVVIDEFSSWVNQFEYNENFSSILNDHIQKWRHYHGNLSHLYIADQCTNNIPIQVRYRCNSAVCCLETNHYLKFIHITHYKNIDLTDAIKNVEVLEKKDADTDDKTLKMIRFSFKRRYDDRAYSNRYYFVDGNPSNSKIILSPLKVNETLKKPEKKRKYIDIDERMQKM